MAPRGLGVAVVQLNVLCDRLLALWVGRLRAISPFYAEQRSTVGHFSRHRSPGPFCCLNFFQSGSTERPQLGGSVGPQLEGINVCDDSGRCGSGSVTPIVAFIFQRGAFDAPFTTLTSRALAFCGLVCSGPPKFSPVFLYAHGAARTPI